MAYIKLEDLQKYPIRLSHYDKEHGNKHFVYGVESVLEYAECLPTADVVEVKHGEWIEETYIDEKRSDFKCSVCEFDDTFYRNLMSFYKYCPYCGAKMDGKKVRSDGDKRKTN